MVTNYMKGSLPKGHDPSEVDAFSSLVHIKGVVQTINQETNHSFSILSFTFTTTKSKRCCSTRLEQTTIAGEKRASPKKHVLLLFVLN